MAAPPSPQVLALAVAMQAQLPECVKYASAAGVAASGCGLDFECICTQKSYLITLSGVIASNCSAADAELTTKLSRELCITAVPRLNESLQSTLVAVAIVLAVLSTVCVVGRFISRRMKGNELWWDDYTILLALAFTHGMNFLTLYAAARDGYGKHIAALLYSQVYDFIKVQFATQLVFACATNLVKISILLLYHRIFPSTAFKKAFLVIGGINVALWICQIVASGLSCIPIAFYWDKKIPNGHCLDLNTFAYGITAANFVTDILVWLLPIPWLWSLQMKLPRKLAVIGIFLVGGLVCLASIIRLPLLTRLDVTDFTWTVIDSGIWFLVECNLGIVCACLPIMRPLLQALAPCVNLRTNNRSLETVSPFPSRPSRRSKYNRSGSGSSKGLKGSSEHIVVSHELEIASQKGIYQKPDHTQGFYTTATPRVVGGDAEKGLV